MPLTIASVFSGIGGIERGMEQAGHKTVFQCEVLETAREVLKHQFDAETIKPDLTKLRSLPDVDLVTAGFPCQNLSQAGRMEGIGGQKSSLINNLFDLLKKKRKFPQWLLLENVPFMLQLNKGEAMRHVTSRLESLGMKWAYRIVDTRAFGLPQRRRRVVLLASRDHDPRTVLFADESKTQIDFDVEANAYGFYWTEGNTGLGWTVDGVPTLKGGSGIGIPCPPAIWLVNSDKIVTPDIRDAERLQGFPANWTKPVMNVSRRVGDRWKLIGNAVSVPTARWIGKRLENPASYSSECDIQIPKNSKWPNAAWGHNGDAYRVEISEWPKCYTYQPLDEYLNFPTNPLSLRATSGFFGRLKASNLNRPADFDKALASHVAVMENAKQKVAMA